MGIEIWLITPIVFGIYENFAYLFERFSNDGRRSLRSCKSYSLSFDEAHFTERSVGCGDGVVWNHTIFIYFSRNFVIFFNQFIISCYFDFSNFLGILTKKFVDFVFFFNGNSGCCQFNIDRCYEINLSRINKISLISVHIDNTKRNRSIRHYNGLSQLSWLTFMHFWLLIFRNKVTYIISMMLDLLSTKHSEIANNWL